MILQNPYLLGEHIRLHRADLMRAAEAGRLAAQRRRQPGPGQRLLGGAGALLVRAGANLQRYAGQQPAQPAQPVRI